MPSAHGDLKAIVEFCREHRGEYDAVPNERALWVRISNTIEAETAGNSRANIPSSAGWWFRLMNRHWQLSFPQLAGAVAVIVLVVSLATVMSIRNLLGSGSGVQTAGFAVGANKCHSKIVIASNSRRSLTGTSEWN